MDMNKIMLYNFWLVLLSFSTTSNAFQNYKKPQSQSLFVPTQQQLNIQSSSNVGTKSPSQSLYSGVTQMSTDNRSSSENDTARQIRLNRIILDLNGYLSRYSPGFDNLNIQEQKKTAEEYLNEAYLDLDPQTKKYILSAAQQQRELKSPKGKKESLGKYDREQTYFDALRNVEKQKLLPKATTIHKASTAPNVVQQNPTPDKDSDPNLTINI